MHKYRGKRIDGKGWAYGFYVADIEWAKHYIYYPKHTGAYIQLVRVEVDPATVGQATGLKDKNGVDIYEGDIILWAAYGDKNIGCIVPDVERTGFKIKWGQLKIDWNEYLHVRISEIEIIGNTTDNPDLLTTQTTTDGNK